MTTLAQVLIALALLMAGLASTNQTNPVAAEECCDNPPPPDCPPNCN